jgi:hypothetical protein
VGTTPTPNPLVEIPPQIPNALPRGHYASAERHRPILTATVRQTAARYQYGTYVEMPLSDHMVFSGAALPVTMGQIDDWLARNHVLAIA